MAFPNLEGGVVGGKNTARALDAVAVGIVGIHREEKLVGHLAVGWDSCPETKSRKHFVRVVILDYLANRLYGRGVLIFSKFIAAIV